jgi:acyl-CoA thioesterase-1
MESCRVQITIALVSAALGVMCFACTDPASPVNTNRNGNLKTTSNSRFPAGPIVYVALGDSTGSGVGAREGGYVARLFKRLEAQRPGSKLTNLCFSGATSADVIREQLESGVRAAPHLVTLGIGINDIGHGVSIERFVKNYEEILAKIRNSTSAVIVVTNLPDISSAPRIPESMRAEYQQSIIKFNDSLTAIAAKYDAKVFDVFSITTAELPAHPEYFSGDGFHPSDGGYELWSERMWPTVAAAIGANEKPAKLR